MTTTIDTIDVRVLRDELAYLEKRYPVGIVDEETGNIIELDDPKIEDNGLMTCYVASEDEYYYVSNEMTTIPNYDAKWIDHLCFKNEAGTLVLFQTYITEKYTSNAETKVETELPELPPPCFPKRIRKGDAYLSELFSTMREHTEYLPIFEKNEENLQPFTNILVPYRLGLNDNNIMIWKPEHVISGLTTLLLQEAGVFTEVTVSKDNTKVKAKSYDSNGVIQTYYCISLYRTPIDDSPDMLTINVARMCGDSMVFYPWFKRFEQTVKNQD